MAKVLEKGFSITWGIMRAYQQQLTEVHEASRERSSFLLQGLARTAPTSLSDCRLFHIIAERAQAPASAHGVHACLAASQCTEGLPVRGGRDSGCRALRLRAWCMSLPANLERSLQ